MINDIVIVDNVFDNPKHVLELANELSYQNPLPTRDNWKGVRTRELLTFDQEKYSSLVTEIISKTLKKTYGDGYFKIEFDVEPSLYFHKIRKTDIYEDSWKHIDDHQLFAGVVYLSENPDSTCGTTIFKNDEVIDIENVFNRLVLYRSDYLHTSNGGFGQNLTDSRLTLNLFINKLIFRF